MSDSSVVHGSSLPHAPADLAEAPRATPSARSAQQPTLASSPGSSPEAGGEEPAAGGAPEEAARSLPGGLQPLQRLLTPAEVSLEDPTLVRTLRNLLTELSGQKVVELIRTGKVSVNGRRVLSPTFRVRVGQRLEVIPSAPSTATDHRRALKVHHIDPQVVVADKPTGLLTLPFEEETDALLTQVMKLLPRLEKKGRVHALRGVHRLDKEASGLVVFARDIRSQRDLQDQFSEHTVTRIYLALVMGQLKLEGRHKVESILVPDRGDGLKGSAREGEAPEEGKRAVTWITVLERFSDCTLVRCELETGRTHQIRIHLAELGYPLVGEPVYIRDWRGRLSWKPSRMMLHAVELAFDHPRTRERLAFESVLPRAFAETLGWLRRRRT